MTISANKTYQTRDGFPVRILATDIKGSYPIAGVVDLGDEEYCRKWTAEGKADRRPNVRTNYDLVEAKKGGVRYGMRYTLNGRNQGERRH